MKTGRIAGTLNIQVSEVAIAERLLNLVNVHSLAINIATLGCAAMNNETALRS
ncbi:MAG: hypothetical protein M0Z50_18850 [Planctomycetia bacterium]|jgi:hypothetical protein|nr:hypothetical protein [Planctomycetia bacterium]